MGKKVVALKNKQPEFYGRCLCGHKEFLLVLNPGDHTTVTHIKCGNKKCGIKIELETDEGFDVECWLDN